MIYYIIFSCASASGSLKKLNVSLFLYLSIMAASYPDAPVLSGWFWFCNQMDLIIID